MKERYRHLLRLCVFGILAFSFVWDRPTTADDEIAIIVNPANSVSGVSPGDLHRIFLGDKSTWPNGKHIFLVMSAAGSPERAAILKDVYKMTEAEYTKYFIQATFTGTVSAPPKEAASDAEIKQLVAANSGAIGYVKASAADDSVKVLLKVP